jgi:NitT/TauT family transport system ATP-binding protein
LFAGERPPRLPEMHSATKGKLVFKDVALTYAGKNGKAVAALGSVSFDVQDGEFVCLMGPSGCGKTTLLNVSAGFLSADAGSVTMEEVPVTAPSSDRPVVFQEYALFPWKTALQNVAFGLKAKRLSAREQREKARGYLRLAGLSASEDALPSELSGGMRQRVALARALAVEPKVLLMDEPLGALDAQTRELLQEELTGILESQHKTILMVTHSVDEAVYLGDRIVILSNRPAKVAHVREVKLPRPRRPELRQSAEYFAVKSEVAAILRSLYDSVPS